ncbi:MAG: hypothetical protein V3T07_09750 [Myxococcota bacterium]
MLSGARDIFAPVFDPIAIGARRVGGQILDVAGQAAGQILPQIPGALLGALGLPTGGRGQTTVEGPRDAPPIRSSDVPGGIAGVSVGPNALIAAIRARLAQEQSPELNDPTSRVGTEAPHPSLPAVGGGKSFEEVLAELQAQAPGGGIFGGERSMPMHVATALPGGAPLSQAGVGGALIRQFLPFLGGVAAGEIAERGLGALFGGGGGGNGMFRVGAPHAHAVPLFDAVSPTSGVRHFWRHVGTPLVFTGDLALRRRLEKTGRKISRGR